MTLPVSPQSLLSRAQWRCLRVLNEVGDMAHAARKLHCSQAALKGALDELQTSLGTQHIAFLGEDVQLSPALQVLLSSTHGCASGVGKTACGVSVSLNVQTG